MRRRFSRVPARAPRRSRHRRHPIPAAGLCDSQEIHQVSLYVGWQGQPERELDMDDFEAFYDRLRRDPELPTTSQPSIGDSSRSGSRCWSNT